METEEVLRWSPIIWLLGVLIAGLACNGVFYCRRLCVRRRQHADTESLYSTLPLPLSYPCLAPPPHEGCCRDGSVPDAMPYTYRAVPLLPPSYSESTQQHGNDTVPPKYEEVVIGTPVSPPRSAAMSQHR